MAAFKTYEERCAEPFAPPEVKFSELQAAVPAHLRRKSFAWAMVYVARCSAFCWLFYTLASRIDSNEFLNSVPGLRWVAWANYWFWQSVALAGIFTLGTYPK